ncbi:hypothetical protein [Trujillonella humicola]|uniref:hypothetical protein n=1 Tax=Trujillonella humicola TaxID=3383699 RepID=UPI0039069057
MRSLPAATLLLAALLGPVAWTSAPDRLEPAASTVVTPADPAGRTSTPLAVAPAADGGAVVFARGAELAAVTTVTGGTVTGQTAGAVPGWADSGFVSGGEVLVGRWSQATGGYALAVLGADGTVVAERPVTPWPADVGSVVTPVPTPDGRLLLAVSRAAGGAQVLLVDPATGAVTAAAVLPGDPAVEGADRVEVDAVAVAPEGGTVVVAVSTTDLDARRQATALVRLDAGLRPAGAPVPVTPEQEWTHVERLAVDVDATAWAVSVDAGGPVIVSAAPGAVEATARTRPADHVAALAVRDGVVWLVPVDRGLRLDRIDPVTGETASSAELCEDGPGSGGALAVTATTVYLAGECGAEERLWEFAVTAGGAR